MMQLKLLTRAVLMAAICFGIAGVHLLSTSPAGAFEPKRGSVLRKELLDTIRPKVQTQMRRSVIFVVHRMQVEGDCAFLVVDPRKKNGRPIDIKTTIFARDRDFMDGLTVYALLKFANGHWREFASATGPTDVVFEPWPDEYQCPKSIFGFK